MKFGGFNITQEGHTDQISVAWLLALAGGLMFVNMMMLQSFTETRHVKECHADAVQQAESVSEDVDAAEYYEFSYRACMRALGETI